MPTFDEFAHRGDCPVIHTKRKDGTTLIATRIPLDDVRLERWGWILTPSHTDGNVDQDDVETLRDNTGRQYPKVYLLTDMRNFIERWGCTEWEEGYQINGYAPLSSRNNTPSETDFVQIDQLKQILSELQTRQEEQIVVSKNDLKAQLDDASNAIGTNNAKIYETLQEETINTYNRLLDQYHITNEEVKKQLERLDQSVPTHQDIAKNVEVLNEEIKNQLSLVQKGIK